MNETNHSPNSGAKPRPLVLTITQKALADELRDKVRPWFDEHQYGQVPLAHGFLDCMAIAIESAGRDDEAAMTLGFQYAYNYFTRLSTAEGEDPISIAEDVKDEKPPF